MLDREPAARARGAARSDAAAGDAALRSRVEHDAPAETSAAEKPDAAPADERGLRRADAAAHLARHSRTAATTTDDRLPQLAAESPTLRDHLRSSSRSPTSARRDRLLVELLIDALDEDGYLTQPLEEIAAMLPARGSRRRASRSSQIALGTCRTSSPPASARARPAECLALQLADAARIDAGSRELALRDRRASTSSCSPRATTRA